MKRKIYINWLIFCCLVKAAVASEINVNESNIQNVKREIEFNEIRNAKEEVRIVGAAGMNAIENGIEAVGSSICSIDLKLMMNGLKTRKPWAISSKFFYIDHSHTLLLLLFCFCFL